MTEINEVQHPQSVSVTKQQIEALVSELQPIEQTKTRPSSKLVHSNVITVTTDEARLRNALKNISPDVERGDGSYDTKAYWQMVIWAIKSTGLPNAEEIAKEWSIQSTRYKKGEWRKVWKSYNPELENPIGVGSLYKLEKDLNRGTQTYGEVNLSDLANGKRYANEFRGQLKFVRDTHKVLTYDTAKGWVIADSDRPIQAAKIIVQQMASQAAEQWKERPEDGATKRLMREVARTAREPAIKAMVNMARSENGMSIGLEELDADNFLLGTTNGVINLKTGQLLPLKSDLLVTKRINAHYDPDADCPRYKQFLDEAIPNAEERAFLNRWNGYCLSGTVVEQKLLFLKGTGWNGKTVWLELTMYILGDYADKIQTEMLMRQYRSTQSASPDLVRLQGRRFIYANETTEGQRLDDARVKELTGGDTITGRLPYAIEAISFSPTHKLVIAGNHAPIITDDSEGLWRRMILMPFTSVFKGKDRDLDLQDKLRREASGILNLWLEGFHDWKANGLQVPDSLTRATNAYRDEQDLLLDWMNEECELAPNLETEKLTLFTAYKRWCEDCSYRNLSKGSFSRKLTGRGYKVTSDKRRWIGIGLKNPLGAGLR